MKCEGVVVSRGVQLEVSFFVLSKERCGVAMKLYTRQELLSAYSNAYPPAGDIQDLPHSPFVSHKPLPPVLQTPLSQSEQELSASGQWVITQANASSTPAARGSGLSLRGGAGRGAAAGGAGFQRRKSSTGDDPPAPVGARRAKGPVLKPLASEGKDDAVEGVDVVGGDFTVVGLRGKPVANAAAAIGKPVSRSASQVERDFNSSWRRKEDEPGPKSPTSDLLDGGGGSAALNAPEPAVIAPVVGIGGDAGYPPGIPSDPLYRSFPRSWWYQDFHGVIQGPFSSEQMKGWFHQGYIPLTLPVRSSDLPTFVLLQDIFLMGDKAFLDFIPPLPHHQAFPPAPHVQEHIAVHHQPSSIYSPHVGSSSLLNQRSTYANVFSTQSSTRLMNAELDHPDEHAHLHEVGASVVDHVLDSDPPVAPSPVVEPPVEVASPVFPSPRPDVVEKSQSRGRSPVKQPQIVESPKVPVKQREKSPLPVQEVKPHVREKKEPSTFEVVGKKSKAQKKVEKEVKVEKEEIIPEPSDSVVVQSEEVPAPVASEETPVSEEKEGDMNGVSNPLGSQALLPSWTAKPANQLSLREIMEKEEEEARKLRQLEESRKYTMAGRIASTKAAWSATAASNSTSSKGLLEIMQEQEKKVQSKPVNMASAIARNAAPAPAKTGWASVATPSVSIKATQEVEAKRPVPSPSISGGWATAGQPKTKSSLNAVSSVPVQEPSRNLKFETEEDAWGVKPGRKPVGLGVQPSVSGIPTAGKKGNGNEFGGPSLPPEFLVWCKKQLTAITGNDDTTLVSFLSSLKSADAIRDYIYEYLGRSSEVEEFANEFILQKEFVENPSVVVVKNIKPKNGDEEDFTAVEASEQSKKSKKKKKKKVGAPLV
jgi:hypothetical protein